MIAATNRDLQSDIEQGKFRRDLYYRINTITININPFRERPEDIFHLIDYFHRKYSSQFKDIGCNLRELDLSELHFKNIKKEVSNQIEKKIISHVLEVTGWNRVKDAKLLHVSYRTLFNKIGELNIERPMLI